METDSFENDSMENYLLENYFRENKSIGHIFQEHFGWEIIYWNANLLKNFYIIAYGMLIYWKINHWEPCR